MAAFYENAIPNITVGISLVYIKPKCWTVHFDKEQEILVPSEYLLSLSDEEWKLVALAKNLVGFSGEFDIGKELEVLDPFLIHWLWR